MYQIVCSCGHESNVRASQAGSQVTCACGIVNSIPSLSVLRDDQQQNQPTRVSSPIAAASEKSDARSLFKPSIRFLFGCGDIGPSGSISRSALTHFIQALHSRIDETMFPAHQRSFSELAVSIAIAPNRQMRVEFDVFPPHVNFVERETLMAIFNETETPPVHKAPIAFAFLLYAKPIDGDAAAASAGAGSERRLRVFPSLIDAIESLGLEEAIRRAFLAEGLQLPKQPSRLSKSLAWIRNQFARLKLTKPKVTAATRQPTAEEEFADQLRWLEDCESRASHYSWIELKQYIAEAPNDFRFQVMYAEKLRLNESWKAAIEWYDRLVDWTGPHAALLGRRAALHQAAGNSEAALRDLNKAIDDVPNHPEFRVQRSQLYYGLEAWDEAIADLDTAVRLMPIDPEPLFQRATAVIAQRQFPEAIADFCEVVRLDPNHSEAHFLLGWLYANHTQDKSVEAIEHLSRAIRLTPHITHIWLQRSLAYLSQNKYELAIEDCEQVLLASPDSPEAHGVLGRILQCDGRYEESIAACSRAIELGHEHPLVYLARAICYACTGQTAQAVEDCDSSLAIEPDNAWAIHLRGQLQLQSGDLDAAMNLFNRARELAPDWTEPREHLALVLQMKEDPQAAVVEQTSLIEQHPQRASHYVNRAFSYAQMNAYEDAAKDYDRAIAIEPENERLYYLRGVFRMKCQQTEMALADFDRVLALTGGDDNARAHRATLLLQLRRFEEAIDDFAQLISKYPDHPQAYSGRAIAFAARGNTEDAEADSERVDEMAPDIADEVRQQIRAATFYRLLRADDYDAALNCAEQIVIDYPELSIGYRLRAHARWEREEYVEAADDYTHVLDLDGPTPDCLSSRGQVRAELGEWDAALADLDRAVAMAREQGQSIVLAYALNGRALTLSGLDRDEDSTRDFDESVSLCPTNPWVYYHRGVRLFHLQKLAASKIMLELALEFTEPPLSQRKKQRAKTILAKIARASGDAA